MTEVGAETGYLDNFRARGAAIADACTRYGARFGACPMVAPAGLGEFHEGDIANNRTARLHDDRRARRGRDLDRSVGLAVLPAFERELVARELAAVADAGVMTLATIYHA
jgi:hypothetical protein